MDPSRSGHTRLGRRPSEHRRAECRRGNRRGRCPAGTPRKRSDDHPAGAALPPLDLATPTAKKHIAGSKAVITPTLGALFNASYVPERGQRTDPLASPVYSTLADLRGIAPALVITPEFDRLHDDGVRYAELLDEAGSLLEHQEVTGVDHGYNLFGSTMEQTRAMYAIIAETVATANA